ncbi:DUF3696 domain-containing protein [uncultured Desulfosarcina sp.]|uniref:AAA family ATPase n=1 Tax=uncultured Desulfosarcina sp. TaxID=218289 RepID=UPI0029C6A91C|nr:DUF3696 domain-containing protein [uncultured Desulfosarcina sp.]
MIKQLRIKNFKVWKETGTIRMAPISLFFGANSSGKSSIGQFLMMLKQTVESPDRKAVFYPGGKNSAVQLGSYQEMVFHRNPENEISFEYLWSLPKILRFKDHVSGKSFSGDELGFEAEVALSDSKHHLLQVKKIKYRLLQDRTQSLSVELSKKHDKREYKVTAGQYNLVRKKGRPWALKDVVRFYGFPDEAVAYYQNAEFVQELSLEQENLFKSICYLGPLRTKTDRLYTWTGITPESVGFSGENTVAAILSARDRKIGLGPKRPTKPLEEIVASKLAEMGLIEKFKVNQISEQRQEYEVKIRTKGSKDWVDLPDVGFGISQVLPVLVQCFYAPPGSIILMEQPEIHLHPSAQSALADVMIDVVNSRENGNDRNIQLIIETHSEHFLRRLQRRIAEDAISQEKVSAYFANINKTPAILEPLQIDLFGNIQNWPDNFFGDEMVDITEQAKAAMKKRIMQHEKVSESTG